jgi:hypothetical protein
LPARTAAIDPPETAQFSDSAVFGPLANSAQPPLAAAWPEHVCTEYSAAPALGANARSAKKEGRRRDWTLVCTGARTRDADSSFSPTPVRRIIPVRAGAEARVRASDPLDADGEVVAESGIRLP